MGEARSRDEVLVVATRAIPSAYFISKENAHEGPHVPFAMDQGIVIISARRDLVGFLVRPRKLSANILPEVIVREDHHAIFVMSRSLSLSPSHVVQLQLCMGDQWRLERPLINHHYPLI